MNDTIRIGLGLIVLFLLAACGDEQMLTPARGASLPIKPLTAATQPDADHLLLPTAQARPGRSDELLIRSQVRRDDHFDLPPQ